MESKMTELEEGKEYRLIDYSQSDFIAWNREREMHLQTIEHLKARVNELAAERDMWLREATKTVVHFGDR
jgi:hypothetical protein